MPQVNLDFATELSIASRTCAAAAAYAGRHGIQAWQAFKARPPTARIQKFYEGGFQPKMTRREAALILGVRESIQTDKVREAHRQVMVANHPDAGGSHYLASKINEAKDIAWKDQEPVTLHFNLIEESQQIIGSGILA
ncbi:Mitochondrial import inner membrane translocase subunit TIM14 [Forsythia ovata]|uniref:Mitochondrial import inner membrane translocase subunit TIM14 n=1 Tax=Forsythia ovata TaxID=205694 RepID=A0ABD1TNT3_9LAMI